MSHWFPAGGVPSLIQHRNAKRILAISVLSLFMAGGLYAQTQGNAIQLVDCYMDARAGNNPALGCGVGDNCTQYPEALNTNDVIVLTATQENASCAGGGGGVTDPPWTISDSQSNTWSTLGTATAPGGANGHMQTSCMKVTNPGTDQITVTGLNTNTSCGSSYAICRFKNASCNLDGSVQSANTATGSGLQTMSTSTTTTINGDLLVSSGVPVHGPQGNVVTDGSVAEYAAYPNVNAAGADNVLMNYDITSNRGSYSMGMAICCSGSLSQQAYMQTFALKPASTIVVADTVLHDAAASVAYAEQLHGSGGIAALTYACTGLPANGLSLNTSTGLISGSTPTAGTLTLGCTVTDGTNTSASQPLTLKIGAGFNNIVVKSFSTFSGDTQPSSQLISAACGDIIIVGVYGADTHHAIGWIPATSGINNFWSDSFGSPVQRLVANAGIFQAPLVFYVFGPLTQSGADIISYANNGLGSAALPPALLMDISGAQGILDFGTFNSTTSSGALASIAQSITTLVPNEYVLAAAVAQDPLSTISMAAPFSVFASGNGSTTSTFKAYASATAVTASTVTATSTLTGGTSNTATTLLMALRPALPGACTFTGAGEKKRRSMN